MLLQDCNPFIRTAQIQPAIIERTGLRKAYDYRFFYIKLSQQLPRRQSILQDREVKP